MHIDYWLYGTFLSTVATKTRMLALNQAIPVFMRATASWRLLGSPSSSVAARLSALNELSSKARNRFNTYKINITKAGIYVLTINT